MVPSLPQNIGPDLVLRSATPADAEALAEFNSRIHSEEGPDQPNLNIAAWTRDLLTRPHPTFTPDLFTVVEETATQRIVSSLNLIPQIWEYEGIPFGVGRPELVGTLPEYRGRGLVRAQFDLLHAWSAARGDLAQAITGIPYFYRQFGYEMGLELSGGRASYSRHVPPALPVGETEPYLVRPVTEADLPQLQQLEAQAARRYLIHLPRTEAQWRYDLWGASTANINRREVRMIATPAGETVGYLMHPTELWQKSLMLLRYELCPGVSWLAVTPSVVRYLWAEGQAYAQQAQTECQGFGFWFGTQHPAYEAWRDRLPNARPTYAWYVRVPDLVAFLRRIAPVLERRLAHSIAPGHTGTLKLNFYRQGVYLTFEQGQLTRIGAWQPTPAEGGDAAFPDYTFLQLLFGYRSLDALRQTFADCWASHEDTRALLTVLFPQKPSSVWPVS